MIPGSPRRRSGERGASSVGVSRPEEIRPRQYRRPLTFIHVKPRICQVHRRRSHSVEINGRLISIARRARAQNERERCVERHAVRLFHLASLIGKPAVRDCSESHHCAALPVNPSQPGCAGSRNGRAGRTARSETAKPMPPLTADLSARAGEGRARREQSALLSDDEVVKRRTAQRL